ncbi:hypothetical protein NLM27_40135 [Bradyrhizobium sp. CCGB12]|uniref:hypothetical protein n=1 Tax=Bradyrhizobium sp. CCGB12 TaxID=2949632 RepID=UPI0020B28FB5|nr:hypothetical protein [Bradyrhizobium sp. CCGB12]MCP3394961.1 hypothetical protein [Bradyrhizobium sp. CCGB12]
MSSKSTPSRSIVDGKDRTIQPDLQRFVAEHMDAAIFKTDNGRVILSQPDSVLDAIGTAANGVQSAEPMHTYSAIVNVLTATEMHAQAGLNWLSAQPPDLEQVRQALDAIVNVSKRTGEIVVRLRPSMREAPGADGALDP